MSATYRLHFTIGPVQGFVAQARRTRDLWAGSFLLSYLSGCAMARVVQLQGGDPESIVFPRVGGDLQFEATRAVLDGSPVVKRPGIASLPNRFVARLDAASPEDAADMARAAADAVREAWRRAAEAVWKSFVEPVADLGKDTRAIWERQIDGFWEISWAIGEDGDMLDRRKNWRSQNLRPEGGDQCTIMSGMQEISGYVRIRERAAQDRFWRELRAKGGLSDMELRSRTENGGEASAERLCAIALVKRLFAKRPEVAEEAVGWPVEAANWPATPFMAAVPFIRQALARAPEAAEAFVHTARELCGKGIFPERETSIRCLEDFKGPGSPLRHIDGDLLFRSTIEDTAARIPELGPKGSEKRGKMAAALKALEQAAGCAPSPFYAVLLMDGDSMGEKLQAKADRVEEISKALTEFATGVPEVVKGCDGVTVYAGGEDVLALLPVDRAIEAGRRLDAHYHETFRRHDSIGFEEEPTISGAIVIADFSTPLLDVMSQAHHLLGDIAKDRAGRDALGLQVIKGGVVNAEWAMKWSRVERLLAFMEAYAKASSEDRDFSSGFLYKTRETLQLLQSSGREAAGTWFGVPEGLSLKALLVGDYLRSRTVWPREGGEEMTPERKREKAERMAGLLLDACTDGKSENRFLPDGMLLGRFFSQNTARG